MTDSELCQTLQVFMRENAGKVELQPFFEEIHRLALVGMNIGQGGAIETSGELSALEYIQNKLKNVERPKIFDVGANVGDYSAKILDFFGKNVDVYAFEPSLKTFQTLEKRLDGQGINLHNVGLSNQTGIFTLFSNADHSGLSSLTKRRLDHFNIAMNHSEKVYIRTIDEFCQEQGIDRIHLLKVDVEGWEMGVFQGAQQMLSKRAIDFIQFEFGGCNIDTKTYLQDFWYLLKDDFLFHRIVGNGLFPIHYYREQLECFITTNYFLENKFFSNV